MASFNRVILVGTSPAIPELRYIPSGMAVTDIGLAVNDRRKGANGEWIEETTFVDVTLWGRTAEIAGEYLTKGSPVLIEGRLKLDTWEANDGQKRSKLRWSASGCSCSAAAAARRRQGGGGARGGGPRAAARRAAVQANRRHAVRRRLWRHSASGPNRRGGDDIPF